MIRDMDLYRKLLLKIEEDYEAGDVYLSDIKIEGYEYLTIAEHCDLIYQEGLIKNYKAHYASDTIFLFQVWNLTNKGYNLLDKIRDEKTWDKIKKEIKKKKLPETVQSICAVAGSFVGALLKEFNN